MNIKRYQITIHMHTEQMEWGNEAGAYVGYNPDTYTDYGIVHCKNYKTLDLAIASIGAFCERPKDIEAEQLDDGPLELTWQCDGEGGENPLAEFYTAYIEVMDISDAPANEVMDALNKFKEGIAK